MTHEYSSEFAVKFATPLERLDCVSLSDEFTPVMWNQLSVTITSLYAILSHKNVIKQSTQYHQ